MIDLIDTHCHIHFPDYPLQPEAVIKRAFDDGVSRLICVGCSVEDSRHAVEFVQSRDNLWASIGIHPHEAKEYEGREDLLDVFKELAGKPKVIAIGECGLDYFYTHSPKALQIKMLEYQLNIAKKHDLPLIFHVREAFADFWPIYQQYKPRGVLHSFTDSMSNLRKALDYGLYIGVNGIATFTKKPEQLDVFKAVPLESLLFETDAPFLTPTPYRGSINEPKYVRETATFISQLRGENLDAVARATTANAQKLFGLN